MILEWWGSDCQPAVPFGIIGLEPPHSIFMWGRVERERRDL